MSALPWRKVARRADNRMSTVSVAKVGRKSGQLFLHPVGGLYSAVDNSIPSQQPRAPDQMKFASMIKVFVSPDQIRNWSHSRNPAIWVGGYGHSLVVDTRAGESRGGWRYHL